MNTLSTAIDFSKAIDISIPFEPHGVNAFWAPDVVIEPFQSGDFIGDVNQGGSVNFRNIQFNPHGNGTHTECVGHIHPDWQKVNEIKLPFFMGCELVTLVPQRDGGDLIITREALEMVLSPLSKQEAIVLRTLPNEISKKSLKYSGANPPYFAKEAMHYLVSRGYQHFLTDLPSVDKEQDGGRLEAHKVWWDYDGGSRFHCTITELVYVDSTIPDGRYMLHLGLANFPSDAVPSRPILFPLL